MSTAPIIVFAYNRPEHLKKTLDALSCNMLADESILYIYCDGPKKNTDDDNKRRIEKVRLVARSTVGFKDIHVIERGWNYGLANNIVDAVTQIVKEFGRVITLEDDVVTSPGFLCYMNDALEYYQEEEKVMHISGYMYPHRRKLPETFFFPVPYPGGGWATWARAWRYYNDDTITVYEQWKDRWNDFDVLGGDYLSKQLIANYNGTLRTWFVKWHAAMLSRNALTLYPYQSLTNNIGFDNLATNCSPTTKFDVKELASSVHVGPIPLKINKKASRIIYDFYQGHWYNKRRRKALIQKVRHLFLFGK